MTWLIIIVAIIAYIVIGQFVAGMVCSDVYDDEKDIAAATLGWPVIIVALMGIYLFMRPLGRIRKLGKKFGRWFDRKEMEYERKD